jgi:hypothetical protein
MPRKPDNSIPAPIAAPVDPTPAELPPGVVDLADAERAALTRPTLSGDHTKEIVRPADAPPTVTLAFRPGLAPEERPNQAGRTRFVGDGPFTVEYVEGHGIARHFPEAFVIVGEPTAPESTTEEDTGDVG